MKNLRGLAMAALAMLLCAAAEPPAPAATSSNRELVVAIKEAPPFVIKGGDGSWQGISIDLWRHLSEQLHLQYRFVEMATVQDLLDATASRSADASVAAITVTAARARTSDFTQQFYDSGLGVAVSGGTTSWLPVLRTFLSFGFLQVVLSLLGIALVVGVLVWLFEHRENEHFTGHPVRGLTSGIWWSAVAMTQAGAAQGAPASLPGRVVAVVWMVASIITLAIFTAGLTSAITTHQLQGLVRNPDDLRSLRVGAVDGSSTVDFLNRERVGYRVFPDPRAGLRALQAGRIDAFVYDRPLLTWIVRQDFSALQMLAITFDRQGYAIALPPGSTLRKTLDVALLDSVHSEWWQDTLYRYLGAPVPDAVDR